MLLIALVLAGTPAGAAPLELYVSPQGNDQWSGRFSEPRGQDGPLASIPAAQRKVRQAKAAGALPQGATVFVREGVYELAQPVSFGPDDSGTPKHPVVYREYPGEHPSLVGAQAITGFEPYQGDILQCDLKGTTLEGVAFRQLFFRGERMTMARTPNVDPEDPHFGTWAHVLETDGPGIKDHFTCTDDVIGDWTKVDRAQVCIHPAYGWAWNVAPVKSVDRELARIDLGRNVSYELRVGDRYFVQNLLEELDAPGEWYLDTDTSVLYFQPPAAIGEGDVLAPVTGRIIEMKGASNVLVRGFTLEACDGTAVALTDCESCIVGKCVIRNCGSWGVTVNGGHNSGATGNDIHATGAGGISLRGGDRKTLERAGNFADNNYIHHIAQFQRTYNTAVNVNGCGNRVSHNLIHDCYHQGVLMGGNENVVEYNVIHHTNLGSEDTGGIYMSSRDYTVRGNVIRHNIFHHIGGFGKANSWVPVANGRVKFEYPHFTWGIYLDAPETGVHVYGNVLYNVPVCGMFNHSGKDNTWENNIIVDAPGFRAGVWGRGDLFETSWKPLRQARQEKWPLLAAYPELLRYTEDEPRQNTMFNCRFIRNIVYYTEEGGAWMRERNASAWGGGQLVWSYRGHQDEFGEFEFDQNVVYAPQSVEPKFELTLAPGSRQLLDWDEWRATGKDEHSILQDPLFVDPASHDYRLRPDSPALKLGFQQIPLDEIGPHEDELRASWPVVEAPGASRLGDFTTERYFQLPGYEPVEAQQVAPRRGIRRLFGKLAAGEPVTIACFAGGNHAQGGWFKAFVEGLRARHPEADITDILAGIHGGARGSGFSVYRFEHEVLRHRPDLVFIDFGADDAEGRVEGVGAAIEGVVRQAWAADPATDLVFVYAFRLGYEEAYTEGLCPAGVAAHERIARHYGIPSINMGYRMAQMVEHGELVPKGSAEEADGKPVFSSDGVYTSPAANDLYARIIADGMAELSAAGASDASEARAAAMAKPFHARHLQRARQMAITPEMLTGAWEREEPGALGQHFEAIWVAREPGAKVTFRFRGTAASILDLMGPDTGQAKVTVDGEDVGVRSQVDRWCYSLRISALRLTSGLEDAEHTVTVELLPQPPDRTAPIEEAKKLGRFDAKAFEGVSFRFGRIQIVGKPLE